MVLIKSILSGGVGKRLWPISNNQKPKQIIDFFGEKTLLKQTLLRETKDYTEELFITTNIIFLDKILLELENAKVTKYKIIVEPYSYNTSISSVISALFIKKLYGSDMIVQLIPSDHFIYNEQIYHEDMLAGYEMAKNSNEFIIFGTDIRDNSSEFGYIEKGLSLVNNIFRINNFIEKPSSDEVKDIIKNGNYLWNMGIYMLPVDKYLQIIRHIDNKSYNLADLIIKTSKERNNILFLNEDFFKELENISIDNHFTKQIFNNILVMYSKSKWYDLGSWKNIYSYKKELEQVDKNDNVVYGNVINKNTNNSLIYNNQAKTLISINNQDMLIINDDNGILITNKDGIREFHQIIQNNLIDVTDKQNKQFFDRPWGEFRIIEKGINYLIKFITIKGFQSISLQYHNNRDEYWVIISGKAKVTLDDTSYMASDNERIYIPKKTKHRIENIGDRDLKIIEIQMGSFFDEEDIIRIEDIYGRASQNLAKT